MKALKNHLMFIFPLVAILLGIEFYLVFDRISSGFEKRLNEGYSMLAVAKKPLTLQELKTANEHIVRIKAVNRENILEKVGKGMSASNKQAILKRLPYFYDISVDRYLSTKALRDIKKDLESLHSIQKVETFGESYGSTYRLFRLIKFLLKVFIGFLSVVSLLLILKQVEIWKYEHRERMQVMEIFGAPLMLRAGVLFRIAVVDAFFATLFTTVLFWYAKSIWAPVSGITWIVQKQDELFQVADAGLLLFLALFIVILAVYAVVITNTKGIEE